MTTVYETEPAVAELIFGENVAVARKFTANLAQFGEELGLIGAIVVLLMFILLAVAFLRVMRSSTSTHARITTAAVMVWIIGQAFVNIGVVLGVLPVLGVPLPLISAGGTALLTTLVAIGVVLSFARGDKSGAAATPDGLPRS